MKTLYKNVLLESKF